MKCEICGKEILRDSQCINYKYYHNDCIENLLQENKQLKETYKEVFNNYQKLKKDNETLTLLNIHQSNKIQQLKDNWNELKEYCKENTLCYEVGDDENTKLIGSKIHGLNVLDKMQELERSDK